MSAAIFGSVLIVEDEIQLSKTLAIAVAKLGVPQIRVAGTLSEARKQIETAPPELVLLDRGLPDGDGLALCEELRAGKYEGAILILTASGQTDARVRGFDSGADDYLPKPFSWDELSARIRNLARRTLSLRSSPQQSTETWSCDLKLLRVRGPSGWQELTPLEFKLCRHLIESSGRIVSRDELLKHVWGFTLLPKTRTVDHFLGRLRKRFERNPDEPEFFLTVRGAGYRFTATPHQASGQP